MTESDAREIWKKKLDFLLAEEAKGVTGTEKFKLQQDVAEARSKLQKLGSHQKSDTLPVTVQEA